MKKFFFIIIAVVSLGALKAQTSEIPYSVKSSFKSAYKSTQAEWSQNHDYYIVKWVDNGTNMRAFYTKDKEATLVRTEKEVALTELSPAIQNEVNTRFANSAYTFTKGFKVENYPKAVEACEFNMSGGGTICIYFDANGGMVRRELN